MTLIEKKVHFWNESYYMSIGNMQAFCRFTRWPIVTDDPSEVTCLPCLTKMKKHDIG